MHYAELFHSDGQLLLVVVRDCHIKVKQNPATMYIL